jgi:hypothetical protein
VRELEDHSVLVIDEKENRVVHVDFLSDNVADVGRTGDGPGEYRRAGRIWALAGDSSLIADLEAPRWSVLDGPTVVNTLTGQAPVLRVLPYGTLRGTDRGQGVIMLYPEVDSIGRPLLRDSGRVIRADRVDGDTQTVTRFGRNPRRGSGPVAEAAGDGRPGTPVYVVAITVHDEVVLFADGWLAIARSRPYRIDWCTPQQSCRPGPLIERAKRMRPNHKRMHLEIASRTTQWPPTSSLDQTAGWPEFVPPFVYPHSLRDGSALSASPDGRILVERFLGSTTTTRSYDIIDRSGRRVAVLDLPIKERIVGFGTESVYVVVTDDLDVQRLRRHPWP